MKTQTKKKPQMLQGILIDPYKRDIYRIEISSNTDIWRKVLRCHNFDCLAISKRDDLDTYLDLWFDDEGLLAEVPAPRFCLNRGDTCGGGELHIAGYGLLFTSDLQGKTTSMHTDPFSVMALAMLCGLAFEPLDADRFKDADGVPMSFIDEQMRTIELELPGQFRELDPQE